MYCEDSRHENQEIPFQVFPVPSVASQVTDRLQHFRTKGTTSLNTTSVHPTERRLLLRIGGCIYNKFDVLSLKKTKLYSKGKIPENRRCERHVLPSGQKRNFYPYFSHVDETL